MSKVNGQTKPENGRQGEASREAAGGRWGTTGHFIQNMLMLRSELSNLLADKRRNVADECGYPTGTPHPSLYQELFDYESIANRVVCVLPDESWIIQPRIFESDDDKITTSFERAVKDLNNNLSGETNYYEDEEGSAILEVLARADVVSGVGHYGVVLIGTDDRSDLSSPLAFRPGKIPTRKLLHLSCYPESMAKIEELDSDKNSPRYQKPEKYHLTINPSTSGSSSFVGPFGNVVSGGADSSEVEVHWTRIVHIVDNPFSSTVFGIPRQQPVLRRLLDLQKAYAATGEAIWQVGVPGFSVESDPSLAGEVDFDPQVLKDSVEKYMHGFQRWMLSNGFMIKTLAPQIQDFTPHMASLLEAICIQLAIPMRVFRGSEVGERASAEDSKKWRVRIASRRRKHIIPRIICPFINRLIALGILPIPEKGYHVWWPDGETLTPDERSTVALKRSQAMDAFTRDKAREVVPPYNFLVDDLGYDEKEARKILAEAEKLAEARDQILIQREERLAEHAASLIPEPVPSASSVVAGSGDSTSAKDAVFSGGK